MIAADSPPGPRPISLFCRAPLAGCQWRQGAAAGRHFKLATLEMGLPGTCFVPLPAGPLLFAGLLLGRSTAASSTGLGSGSYVLEVHAEGKGNHDWSE